MITLTKEIIQVNDFSFAVRANIVDDVIIKVYNKYNSLLNIIPVEGKIMVESNDYVVIPTGIKFKLPPDLGLSICNNSTYNTHLRCFDINYNDAIYIHIHNLSDKPLPIEHDMLLCDLEFVSKIKIVFN